MKRIDKKYVLKKSIKRKINKLLVLIVIVLIGMILVRDNPGLKETISEVIYTNNFNFMKYKNDYEKYFGNILSVKKKQEVPVFYEKLNYEKASKHKKGVKLKVINNYSVPIIESGVVTFVDDKSVLIEQVDGIKTYYSNISGNYKLYDFVNKGEILGQTKSNYLYLEFKKEGKYLNYKEYI